MDTETGVFMATNNLIKFCRVTEIWTDRQMIESKLCLMLCKKQSQLWLPAGIVKTNVFVLPGTVFNTQILYIYCAQLQ